MDFDKIIDRRNTDCVKYDGLRETFGRDDLLPLWIADMDFEVCPAIFEALEKRIGHKVYGYPIARDCYWNSIISWLNRRHDFTVKRDELCYIPGIVRGIGYVVNHFTSPGDKILIQEPVYHPFKNVIEGNGRIAVNNQLHYSGGSLEMDLTSLEALIKEEKPKMMILCNPHNPGGIIWSKEILKKVAHICAGNGVIVVSDEIHADIELFGNRYTPFATVSEEAAMNSIVLGAPSKTFNIPGLVSSWCVIKNPKIRESFFKWMEVNEFSAPTMFVTLATEAAYNHGEEWLDKLLKYLEGNILFVEDYLRSNIPEIKPLRPQASFLMWLDCSATGLKGLRLDDLFISKAHLALNDGEMFGPGGECHMRLNVACPRKVLEKALSQLKEALEQF